MILTKVDIICAEDTRTTINLLRLLKIPYKEKKFISHHEHNYRSKIPEILTHLKNGLSIAVVSDAGTPGNRLFGSVDALCVIDSRVGIADPGTQLVNQLHLESLSDRLHPVPGPSAVVSALSVCGFDSSDFSFLGFLPVKGKDRREKLRQLMSTEHTVVFFEAPHRILDTLNDLIHFNYSENNDRTSGINMEENVSAVNELSADVLYSDSDYRNRKCVLCRELTKLHEEIIYGENILQCQQQLMQSSEKNIRIRGEFTVVLGPINKHRQKGIENDIDSSPTIMVNSWLTQLRDDGVMRSEAVRLVVEIVQSDSRYSKTQFKWKSEVYKVALTIPWK